ncbi:MAG TPA: lytic transglycosylase domain-containing protein [Longimicrobiaceae bacterium]|nr:lytic transglycosylase domain-containing protein [Longimicrobiaceae bacterium]
MLSRIRLSVPVIAAIAGFCAGVFGTALAADGVRWRALSITDLAPVPVLDAINALPRTEMTLAMLEARNVLRENRPWTAWTILRDYIEDPAEADASVVLLAAEAAAGWGGWDHTRDLLDGREWLDNVDGGEGWYLLGRAEEELGDEEAAAAAYRRFVATAEGQRRGIGEARLGQVLRELDNPAAAAAAFAAAATRLPRIEDWLTVLRLDQLAEAGESSVIQIATSSSGGSAPVRVRRVLAEVDARLAAGDTVRAIERLEWEASALSASGMPAEAANLALRRAPLMAAMGESTESRALLRSLAWEGSLPAPIRLAAANQLGELTNRTAAEELARASAFEAAGKPGVAARALMAAMDAGVPSAAGVQLRLARLLYDERDYGPAAVAFRRAADLLGDAELKAEAELHAARATFRSGNPSMGLADLRSLVDRRPGTAAAGSALFLLADEANTVEQAIPLYRRSAAIEHSPYAREALFRLGDRLIGQGDVADGLAIWATYAERYPTGEATAQIAYNAARMHDRAGRDERARTMYAASVAADPLSYYAIQAALHSGIDPFKTALDEPHPWIGLASDATDAAAVLDRLALLAEVGLTDAWEEEKEAAVRRFRSRPAALVAFAEGLRDSGHPVDGIYLGYDLLEIRDGELDRRVLQLIFPLLFRDLIEREARINDVDPMFLAGLIRRESAYRPSAESWVGATGLGQIMPSTGRWLAPSVGIDSYEQRLLEVPEVNLRMSAYYIGNLLERFDEKQDLALAGYNAGPGRAARWEGELDRDENVDRFRERIPFDETRVYVKIVLRNAYIYDRLYGD